MNVHGFWSFKKYFLNAAPLALAFFYAACNPIQTQVDSRTPTDTYSEESPLGNENHAPIAASKQIIDVEENSFASFTVNSAEDIDGDTLTYTVTTLPTKGTLTSCMNRASSTGSNDLTCLYTPNPNITGSKIDSFRYSVSDGTLTAVKEGRVNFNISPENDDPLISAFTMNYTLDEGEEETILFDVDEGGGSDENVQNLSIKVTSTNSSVIDETTGVSVKWGAFLTTKSGNIHNLGDSTLNAEIMSAQLILNPVNAYVTGTTTITVSVSDNGIDWYDANAFTVTYVPVDDPPTFTSLADSSAAEGVAATFNISADEGSNDPNEEDQSVTLTITSGNAVVVPNANINIDGGGSNSATNTAGLADDSAVPFSVVITPVDSTYNGTITFTATISDGTSTTTQTFNVVWTATDTASTITDTTGNHTLSEDVAITGHELEIDEGNGTDENAQGITVRISTSDSTIIPVANIIPTYNSQSLTGALNAGSMIYSIGDSTNDANVYPLKLNITPATGANGGPVTITVETSDDGTNYDTPATFTVTYNAVDDDPVFVSLANQTAAEGDPVTFTITTSQGDGADENGQTNNLTITSLNTNVVNNAGDINLDSSTATSFTFTITPNQDSDFVGTVTFTATLNDATNTINQDFTVTWEEVNENPTIAAIANPAAISEDDFIDDLEITIDEGGGEDEDTQGVRVRFSSNNSTLIDVDNLEATWNGNTLSNNAGIFTLNDFSTDTSSANFKLDVHPSDNQSGSAIITVEVSDDYGVTWPASQTFTVTVNAANDNPTLTRNGSGTLTTNLNSGIYGYDSGGTYYGLVITPDEGGATDEDTETLTLLVESDNTTLIPYSGIRIFYGTDRDDARGTSPITEDIDADGATYFAVNDGAPSAGAKKLYVDIIPASGQSGSATLTFTLQDSTTLSSTPLTVDVVVNAKGVSHQGWTTIKATGAKVYANGDFDAANDDISVTFGWSNFTLLGGASTPTQWNIYRSDYSENEIDFDFTTPLATVSYGTNTYTDTSLSTDDGDDGKAYWYQVRPVVGGIVTGTSETSYNSVRIVAPFDNMALVHRWAANIDICQKIGSTTSPNNNFRCSYTGPGNITSGGSDYYDFQNDILVDRFETGCAYSPDSCNGTSECQGVSSPDGTVTGNAGDLYYNRLTGECYEHTGVGNTWTRIKDQAGYTGLNPNIASYDDTTINAPGLPPLTGITQLEAGSICDSNNLDVTFNLGSDGTPSASRRLLKRKEQIAASSWVSTLGNTAISTLETGTSFSTNGRCNTNSANGTTYIDTDTTSTILGDKLPGMLSNTIRSVVTGSDSTQNCVSRYGIQDLVGNVAEWVSDRIFCEDANGDECEAVYNGGDNVADVLSTANNDSLFYVSGSPIEYAFSGTTGPCADADANDSCDGATTALTSWTFYAATPDNDATKFFRPMGLPADTDITSSATTSTIGSTITSAELHDDKATINALSEVRAGTIDPGVGGMLTGGDYSSSGNSAGIYSFEFDDAYQVSDPTTGMRCAITIPN